MARFATLAASFDRLQEESGRLGMTAILVDLFGSMTPDELTPTLYLMQGQVAPDWEGLELGLAEKLVVQVIARAAGLDARGADAVNKITARYHALGDLGAAAEEALSGQTKKQVGLAAFGQEEQTLSVSDVHARLLRLARTTGAASQRDKQTLLESLLREATPREARYLVRIVAGRLRLGVADMTVLDALAAWHLGLGVKSVTERTLEERERLEETRRRLERAYDLRSDLAVVAPALAKGMQAVDALTVEAGVPLRCMLAERLASIEDILAKHGTTAVETKYDGLRMQIHVDEEVRIFSRRLEDLTDQFPDVVAMVKDAWKGTPCIVEGECVAWDPVTGRLRPFQELSRRRGRKTGLGGDVRTLHGQAGRVADDITSAIPVRLFLFDTLAADGPCLEEPYTRRRSRLEELFAMSSTLQVAAMEVCQDAAAVETVFQKVIEDGGEGIMCKDLQAPYKAGSRGEAWIKFKADYQEGMADSMDLVVVGAFHGRGRRAGWYGALLMACRDGPEFRTVCKLGTGFDDATLKGLKDLVADLERPARPAGVRADMAPDVWIEPALVAEVEAAELTLSPIHTAAWGRLKPDAGLAARFPRFKGWREDKGADQATTADELVSLYKA